MAVFAGQGDAGRSLRLLWRAPGGGGPGLSVDAIVDAAVEVADREGLAGLSMRAVGERLGRSAMALYAYVPGKAELVDLMCDRVLGGFPAEYPVDAGWRVALRAWAVDARGFFLAHPWVLQVSQARPVLGPNEFAMVEGLLGILRSTGLGAPVVRGVVGAVVQFVRGAAGVVAEARRAARETGLSDEEWWWSRSGVLAEVAPDFAERFPLSAWLAAEGPGAGVSFVERGAVEAFEVGLEVLLDGVEAAVARAGGASSVG
ncbi:TetR/AcrR family transcriptional regulator [Actinosynnema sp. NPDC059335]|uniref:TetR/AcrR family transcriptional regulator n=1 Tax=Actinosynnema sp. NPDC059335 TaxID=3346804 RepID=UPI0036715E0A